MQRSIARDALQIGVGPVLEQLLQNLVPLRRARAAFRRTARHVKGARPRRVNCVHIDARLPQQNAHGCEVLARLVPVAVDAEMLTTLSAIANHQGGGNETEETSEVKQNAKSVFSILGLKYC
jgi:hypothetical protein